MTLSERIEMHREDILNAALRHGARNLRVFGSVARGEERPDSDVDFLVTMDTGRSLLDLAGLLNDLEDLLGCKVDIATEAALKPRYRERVLQEAKPL